LATWINQNFERGSVSLRKQTDSRVAPGAVVERRVGRSQIRFRHVNGEGGTLLSLVFGMEQSLSFSLVFGSQAFLPASLAVFAKVITTFPSEQSKLRFHKNSL
jgi:hypothetical protein